MKAGELIEQLMGCDSNQSVGVIIADIARRKTYPTKTIVLQKVDDMPILCIAIGDSEPFNAEAVQVAEECEKEQTMSIEDAHVLASSGSRVLKINNIAGKWYEDHILNYVAEHKNDKCILENVTEWIVEVRLI